MLKGLKHNRNFILIYVTGLSKVQREREAARRFLRAVIQGSGLKEVLWYHSQHHLQASLLSWKEGATEDLEAPLLVVLRGRPGCTAWPFC